MAHVGFYFIFSANERRHAKWFVVVLLLTLLLNRSYSFLIACSRSCTCTCGVGIWFNFGDFFYLRFGRGISRRRRLPTEKSHNTIYTDKYGLTNSLGNHYCSSKIRNVFSEFRVALFFGRLRVGNNFLTQTTSATDDSSSRQRPQELLCDETRLFSFSRQPKSQKERLRERERE